MSPAIPQHAILIAAQPVAYEILAGMLGELFELHRAHSIRDALTVLEKNPRIALIICTVAFDESRLFDFLQQVKDKENTRDIPFIGCRVISSVLTADSIDRLIALVKFFGAADFLDIARMERQLASTVLRDLVMKHLGGPESVPLTTH
jgi:PleD family two-component response regulator